MAVDLNKVSAQCRDAKMVFYLNGLKKTQHKAQRKSFVCKKLGCETNDESVYLGTFFIQNSWHGDYSTYIEN